MCNTFFFDYRYIWCWQWSTLSFIFNYKLKSIAISKVFFLLYNSSFWHLASHLISDDFIVLIIRHLPSGVSIGGGVFEQITPASSEWLQSLTPQLLILQLDKEISLPVHSTSSNHMGPVPSPYDAPEMASPYLEHPYNVFNKRGHKYCSA